MPNKYTPGPWKNWRPMDVDGLGRCFNIGDSGGWPVALVLGGHEDNARLITAAPELLEALKDAEDQLRKAHAFLCDLPGESAVDARRAMALDAARAAIAKATGLANR